MITPYEIFRIVDRAVAITIAISFICFLCVVQYQGVEAHTIKLYMVSTDNIVKNRAEVPQRQILTEKVAHSEVGNNEKAEAYLRANFSNSPLIGKTHLFYAYGKREGDLALAIAGVESGFGTSKMAKECNNLFGYLYTGTEKKGCGSPKWSTLEKGIARFMELEHDNWLDIKEVSELTEGTKKYCASSCINYKESIEFFLNIF